MTKGLGIIYKLHVAYHPEFRESKMYQQDSKITIGKIMPGDLPTMGLVTAHSLAQD
jgi:hypothetical protein